MQHTVIFAPPQKIVLFDDDNEKYLSLAIPVMSKPEEDEYSKLVELLLALQEDSKLLAAFDKDPDKVMIEAGITSEKYRSILKTRDTLKIHMLKKRNMIIIAAEKKRKGRVKNTVFHGSIFHLK